MKITKSQLKQIIREELTKILREGRDIVGEEYEIARAIASPKIQQDIKNGHFENLSGEEFDVEFSTRVGEAMTDLPDEGLNLNSDVLEDYIKKELKELGILRK